MQLWTTFLSRDSRQAYLFFKYSRKAAKFINRSRNLQQDQRKEEQTKQKKGSSYHAWFQFKFEFLTLLCNRGLSPSFLLSSLLDRFGIHKFPNSSLSVVFKHCKCLAKFINGTNWLISRVDLFLQEILLNLLENILKVAEQKMQIWIIIRNMTSRKTQTGLLREKYVSLFHFLFYR